MCFISDSLFQWREDQLILSHLPTRKIILCQTSPSAGPQLVLYIQSYLGELYIILIWQFRIVPTRWCFVSMKRGPVCNVLVAKVELNEDYFTVKAGLCRPAAGFAQSYYCKLYIIHVYHTRWCFVSIKLPSRFTRKLLYIEGRPFAGLQLVLYTILLLWTVHNPRIAVYFRV